MLEASWTVEIEAPRERCFEIAADIEGAPEWQGTLEEVNVIKRDREDRPQVVETISDASVKKVRARLRFSYDAPGGITWEQEDGDVKSLTGSWTFEDLGENRTRATYALEADPGRMLGMLLRGPVEEKLRELLVDNRPGELKARAEAG